MRSGLRDTGFRPSAFGKHTMLEMPCSNGGTLTSEAQRRLGSTESISVFLGSLVYAQF
jgi:hypothetical protein